MAPEFGFGMTFGVMILCENMHLNFFKLHEMKMQL